MPHIFIPAAFKTSIALSLSEKLKIMYQFCRTSSTLFKPPDAKGGDIKGASPENSPKASLSIRLPAKS